MLNERPSQVCSQIMALKTSLCLVHQGLTAPGCCPAEAEGSPDRLLILTATLGILFLAFTLAFCFSLHFISRVTLLFLSCCLPVSERSNGAPTPCSICKRSKDTQMPTLPSSLQCRSTTQQAHVASFRRSTSPRVPCLWKIFQPERPSKGPHATAHWREAVHVR